MRRGDDGYEPYSSGEELLEAVPEIRSLCDVDFMPLAQLDSADMTPECWLKTTEAIEANYYDYDGFVITHGTDTMAFTAAALSFFLQELGKPIVLTGAQIPMDVMGSDARANLVNAFRVATSNLAEVVIVFGTKIIRGTRARKISAFSLEAFESINVPPLGEIGLTIRLSSQARRRSRNRMLLVQKTLEPRVGLLNVYPGMDSELIRHAIDTHAGLIILGYGAGTIPTGTKGGIIPALEYAHEKRKPIVLGTQCLRGNANPELYRVGKAALRAGVIPMVDMTPEAALVKLMWILGFTGDARLIHSMILKNYVGEIMPDFEEELPH